MPLTMVHSPESNKEEIARVISKGGYISEVNLQNLYKLYFKLVPLLTGQSC